MKNCAATLATLHHGRPRDAVFANASNVYVSRIECVRMRRCVLYYLISRISYISFVDAARSSRISRGSQKRDSSRTHGTSASRSRYTASHEVSRETGPRRISVRDHSRTVGRCHLKTEAILWPSLPYYSRNNSSTTIRSDKLHRIFTNTSRLCMNHFITRSHSHGCDKEVAR